MSLVVEDGTARSDSESYISVSDADDYHAKRGNTAWAGVAQVSDKEALLRKATEFMIGAYRQRWMGYRAKSTQALDWPRYEVPMPDAVMNNQYMAFYPYNEVPVVVQRACAELALRAIDGDLAADLDAPVIEETVGPITTRYAQGARQNKVYQAVEAMLAPLMDGGGNSIPVRRA
jgi:hypothetical protein